MKFRFFLFAVAISFLFCQNSMANKVADKTKDLTGLKVKIKQTAKEIKDLTARRQSLLAGLKKLETKYGNSVSHLAHLEQQINGLQGTLEKNRQQRLIKRQEIKSQKQSLANQVKTAYRMGRNERLKLMLNQQDPAVSERVMIYYDYLNKVRLNRIATIDQNIQVLHNLDIQQKKESAELQKKLASRKQSQLALAKAKTERKALLAKINRQFSSKKQQLKRFKQNEKRLASLVVTLQKEKDGFLNEEGAAKEFSKLKGALPWPVKGALVKKFGDRRSDSRWSGVVIKAKEGQEVRAVTSGQVVFADWLRGYGLLTIIKHDKNYMTLYAFSQSLYKTKGDWVEAGTVISTVGLSDGRSEASLYFAIRKKGKPVNPVKWCRKIRHGNVGQ